jgi:hypothetical protein
MFTEKQINPDEKHDALEERGRRNLPMAAGGASSGTERRGNSCTRTQDLVQFVIFHEIEGF